MPQGPSRTGPWRTIIDDHPTNERTNERTEIHTHVKAKCRQHLRTFDDSKKSNREKKKRKQVRQDGSILYGNFNLWSVPFRWENPPAVLEITKTHPTLVLGRASIIITTNNNSNLNNTSCAQTLMAEACKAGSP